MPPRQPPGRRRYSLKISRAFADVLHGTTTPRNKGSQGKEMRKRIWVRFCLLALAMATATLPSTILAQQVHSEGKRKIIVQIRPVLTPLARRLNLSGTVRLRVTVSPAGDAIRTEELGGSPLLVKAAADGVFKAKWEAAPLPTKEIIEIIFPPSPL